MKRLILSAFLLLFSATGCAGIPLPGTDYRLLEWHVESSRTEINSGCTDLGSLTDFAANLEEQHLVFIRTKDDADALVAGSILGRLSEGCKGRISKLSTPEIKTELFGDVQIISDVTKLTQLGGIAFEYTDMSTRSNIEFSLHLNHHKQGPKRRLVAIYRLDDDRVIHYNYSGKDNVDTKRRMWPIREFFGLAVKAGSKAIMP